MKAETKLSFISLSCEQLSQGNDNMSEGRTISLKYKHGKGTGDYSSRIIGDSSLLSLPSLLQTQKRVRHGFKPVVPVASSISVNAALDQSPFTVMSYKSDVNNNIISSHDTNKKIACEERIQSKSIQFDKGTRSTKNGNRVNARWKAKPPSLPNQSSHPDPLINASKRFMKRVSELSLLQLETVKYESSRRKTRKSQTVQKTAT